MSEGLPSATHTIHSLPFTACRLTEGIFSSYPYPQGAKNIYFSFSRGVTLTEPPLEKKVWNGGRRDLALKWLLN